MPSLNPTLPIEEPQWNSKPAWKLPGWAEPLIVLTILLGAMYFTRRQNYSLFARRKTSYNSVLDDPDADHIDISARSSDELLPYDLRNDGSSNEYLGVTATLPKTRRLCCFVVHTPNTARFRDTFFSRVLQKYPFLIEMFYWVINYAFYRMTSITSQRIFGETNIWEVAQGHGIAVLQFEQFSWLSFLFPVSERSVQQWFMHGHQHFLTALNRTYALIHIPGTVGSMAWYYYAAPSHVTFSVFRRTMTLTNFLAFMTFVLYPCMPPRLLPKEYGFLDSVRHDNAQSVWQSGKYVNTLAAMPSMHFGYSFCIGVTLLWHSTIFRNGKRLEAGEYKKPKVMMAFCVLLGFGYPALILTTIVATANHYWLDAMVATCFVLIAFACNKIFYALLPVEDWLLRMLRAEKPVPSTGERYRAGRR
ncbi:integral membrane protein [Venturia nashicola]|nr:integral membrane protein [Venturia nashicola]